MQQKGIPETAFEQQTLLQQNHFFPQNSKTAVKHLTVSVRCVIPEP